MQAHKTAGTEPEEAKRDVLPMEDERTLDPHFPIEEEASEQESGNDPEVGEPPPYVEPPADPPV